MKTQLLIILFTPLLYLMVLLCGLSGSVPNSSPPPVTYKGIAEGDVIIGELTYYCACPKCNGKWAGITADGTVLDQNTKPIASANWLPLGTVVEIGGRQYRVADRGGKSLDRIGRLDIYVPEGHQAALDAGLRQGIEIVIISLPGGVK